MSDNSLKKLQEIISVLNSSKTAAKEQMNARVIDSDALMAMIEIEGREEFPIILDMDANQITVVTNLWRSREIQAGAEAEMMSAMLAMNMHMPLSAFSRTGDQYQLFGAMALNSPVENIVTEVATLSDNTLEVVEALREFLQ
ncbi:MAG: DUF2170 family protein [Gammaproteobacteria bacterium]|nr:DUF2170 family protein [Gammaproteobacteria bacterium]